MRKAVLIIIAALAVVVPVSAQFVIQPNLPPQTVIGNPNAVNAPAQAIPFTALDTDLEAGNLLTNQTLPSSVDLNNLPPQTVVGNGTGSTAALGFITFSQLSALFQTNLPKTIYSTYDPANVPASTVLGNLSTSTAKLAVPVSLGNVTAPTVPVTTVSIGTAFNYNSNFPTHYLNGDTYYSTWHSDGNIYITVNDTWGVDAWKGSPSPANGSNIQIAKASTFDNTTTVTLVNNMAAWGTFGQTGSDGATYKSTGLISVNGVLYLSVYRQFGLCSTGQVYGSQIIKSTDHGATWTPTPPSTAQPYASPMFTNRNQAFSFIQYTSKDYIGQFNDNSNTYVYAIIANIYDSPSSTPNYLGRVKIANIGNLSAADWTFYTGGDGLNDANWSSSLGSAVAVITANDQISGIQFFPSLQRYVAWTTYEPNTNCTFPLPNHTVFQFYEAPHPWGPWTLVQTNDSFPRAHYLLQPVMKSVNGNAVTVFASGDFNGVNDPDATAFYSLWEITLTMNGGFTPPTPPTGSCSQSTAFFSRVYKNGFTLDSTHQTAYDGLICGMVTDGTFSLFDALYIFATSNSQLAQMNLIQDPFNATQHALVPGPPTHSTLPTFTTDRGFTGEGMDNITYYLDTNFNPTTAAVAGSPGFTLQFAHMSAWMVTANADSANGGILMGNLSNGQESDVIPKNPSDSNVYMRLSDSPDSTGQGVAGTATGHWIVSRTGFFTSKAYQNGALFSSPNGATNSELATSSLFILCINWPAFPSFPGPHGSTANQVAMASFGTQLNGTQASNFYSRLRTYMTAVGVP